MNRHSIAICLALTIGALPLAAQAAPRCVAASGDATTALVELYTSEGCSSCPPADAWLNEAPARRYRPGQVVPLALHVPYWDDLGWKDGLASATYSQRQSWLVARNGRRSVYTPHFFVAGREALNWTGSLDTDIQRVNARPAAARIAVDAAVTAAGEMRVAVDAVAKGEPGRLSLFLAVSQGGLSSAVRAGENRGELLHHEHVARALIGPLDMPGGRLSATRSIAIEPEWPLAQLGVVAFVQDMNTGGVLQAVACRLTE